MKKFIIYLVFLMLCPFLMGQNLQVSQNTYEKVAVSFYPGEISVEDISVSSGDFSRISIMDYGFSYNPGAPQLPMLTKLLQIPVCDSVVVSIVNAEYAEYNAADLGIAHPLYPCQPSVSKSAPMPPFSFNQALYATNELYALPLVSAQIAGIKRNCALANLFVSPVQYNPVSQTIRVYTRIDAEFTFVNADMASTSLLKKYDSPLFDLSKDMVINKMYNPTKSSSTAPVKYLIIAHSTFVNNTDLDNFVAWKRRLGYLVEVAYTNDASVGTTASSIKNYIQNQYNNATAANPAPTYLLLIGDTGQIPAYTSQVEPEDDDNNESNNETHVTDLYYATLAGGDNLPDCYYGRLSATSVSELTPQLDKIMMYEQYTMPDPSYLGKAVLIAGTDSYWSVTHADGQINYAFSNYINTESTTHNFTTVKKYNYNSSNQASTIRNEIGAGAGFVNYTAHGNTDRWQEPEFTSAQVAQMSNANKYGLMIGNCCLSGSFQEGSCFAETLMRAANKGAMGYIGASKETYWDQDVYWAVGMRNSISASMSYSASNLGMYDKLFHTHGENYSNWVSTIGGIVQGGGMSVQNSSSSDDYKKYYWEIYHCFGDPSAMVYLGLPSEMTVSSDDAVAADINSYSAQVPPHAYVALTSNGQLISAAYANANGYVLLPISGQLSIGNIELAVTAQNYIPYFKTIEVEEPNLQCPTPTNLVANDIAPHSAMLSWTNNGTGSSFNIRYKEISESEPIVTEVTSQNFEGGTMPTGWTSEGSALWSVGTGDYSTSTGAHGGSYNARITHGTSGNTTYLVMPAIDLSEANNATLTFWFVNRSWSGDIDEFGVYYRVSGGAWTELWSTTEAHSTWTQQSVSLSGMAANYQIGFKFTDNYGYGVGLDDIVIVSIQTPEATDWVTTTSNTASAMLTGLAAETEYEVQVQANCGNDGNSSWTSAFFTTLEACPAPTEVTVSNVGPNSASLSWTGNSDSYNVQYRIAEEPTTVFSDDFENGIGSWTTVDADGDGFNWQSHINTGSGNFTTHGGDGCAVSASYDNDTYAVLYPDNWLITPQVQLGGTVSFWAVGQSANYAEEHFAVYVSTTEATPSAFTQVSEEFVATGTYTQYTADLSAYSGMGYVAIRHFNVSDMFYLNIDDFSITMNVGTGEWTTVTTNTTSATLTGLTTETSYEVQVQADCGNEGSSSWVSGSFTTTEACPAPTDFTNLAVGPNTATIGWTGYSNSYNVRYRTAGGDAVTFEDGFENGLGNWTIYTEGDYLSDYFSEGWFPYDASEMSFGNHTGNAVALSCSWYSNALEADNWLITPQISLKGTLRFWVYSNYSDEYEVLLSTSGNQINNFNVTLKSMAAAPSSWTEVTIDLSNYNGQLGYIAIHHDFTDGQWLAFDDFSISDSQDAGQWVETTTSTNSLDISGLNPETEYEIQVQLFCADGGTSRWASHTFTTTEACPVPAELNTTDITASTATLNWTGYSDSYNIQYRKSPVFFDDFENGIDNWTILDADEDGFNWEGHINTGSGNFTTHAGLGCAVSASYDNDSHTVLYPDNWLITPQVQLGGMVSFWAVGQEANYAEEHFAVFVSTTGNTPSDFTQVSEEFVATDTYTQYTADLSNYNGMGYVAIRHFNVSDMFYLNIDDFGIYADADGWQVVNNASVPTTISGLDSETGYDWQVQGVCEGNTTAWSSTASFQTEELVDNTYSITLTQPDMGGTISVNMTIAHEGDVIILSAETDDGYLFNSWVVTMISAEGVATIPVTGNTFEMPANDVNVTAVFVPDTFSVTFVTNGGTLPSDVIDHYYYGQMPELPIPTYEGHEFLGWYEDASLEGNAWYWIPDTAKTNKTYYAKWSVNTYTVTTSVSPQNGGEITGENESGNYEYGSVVTLISVPADGYDFVGWWINDENTSSSSDPIYEFTVTGNMNVEARFELHAYTITVIQPDEGGTVAAVLNEGETEITITESGTSIIGNWVQLTYEAAEGYLFGGFVVTDVDGNEIETPNNGFEMPASDVTITAVFTAMPQVNMPIISPESGTYDSENIPTVTISCSTPGATIHYTTDGTEPTVDSPVYTEPLTITGTTIIMAMAEADNMMNSEVATATYTIDQVYYVFVNGNISNGTITATPTSGVAGTQITLGATPEAGYIFDSWIVSLVGTPAMVTIPVTGNTFEMPASDVNVSAVFVPDTFGVSFVLNGGEFAEGYTPVSSYWYGQTDVILPTSDDMVYPGHTFEGWYETSELTGNSWTMVPDTAMSDKTYYAKWTINTYTVTAVVSPQDGGEITGLNETGEYEYGSVVTLTAVPAEGYDFTGWWINHENMASSTDPVYETTVTGDIYAEARFELHAYTITVNQPTVGGTVSAVLNDGETEVTITESGTSVMDNWVQLMYETAEGYLFSGFVVTDADNNEIETPNNGFIMPASDVIITAVFDPQNFTITYMDGNTLLHRDTFAYGSSVTPFADPSKEGYIFTGWEPVVPLTMPAEHLTINAQWVPDTFGVSFVLNGAEFAEGYTPVSSYWYGQSGVMLPTSDDMVYAGHTFGGWYETPELTGNSWTMVPDTAMSDKTYYAKWTINTYTITAVVSPQDGGEITGLNETGEYEYGSVVTLTAVPAEGYDFTGWWINHENMASSTDPSYEITVTEDVYAEARFELHAYTITVTQPSAGGTVAAVLNNGTTEITITEIGTSVMGNWVQLTYEAAEGYLFDRFEVMDADNHQIETPNNGFIMPASDVTVTAVFTAMGQVATPSFSPAPGTYDSEHIPTVTISCSTPGATIHYTMDGTEPTVDSPVYTEPLTITGTTTIMAMAEAENMTNSEVATATYTIDQVYNINVNGDIANGTVIVNPTTGTEGTIITLTPVPDEGYIFGGWNVTDSEGNEIPVGEDNTFELPAGDVNIGAVFVPDTFSVSFVLNGAEFADGYTPVSSYWYGQTGVMLPTADDMVYPGHTFEGWYETPELTGNSWTMIPDTAMSNKTYYAMWSVNTYTVTTSVSPQDGGEITGLNESGEYEYGSVVTLTAVPAEGYDFTGWWINHENMASSTDLSYEITVTEDVYAEARFELHAYTITVTQPTAGGTVAAQVEGNETAITEIGTSVMGNWVQLTYEAAEDYLFSGFVVMDANNNEIETPNNGFIMPASDVTVTAVFTAMGQVATPTFSPTPGTYDSEHIPTVTISCSTPGATIHYTTDGTEPTVDSPVYTEPLTITGTITIMAMAEADNMTNSEVATATYTIDQVYNINVDGDIANGTVVVDPTTGTEGTVITLTPIPDEGYTFGGWNVTDGEGNEIPVGEDNTFELPAGDVNIGAFFVPDTFSVSFVLNGAEFAEDYTPVSSYWYGQPDVMLPTSDNMVYAGYTFEGWYETPELTGNSWTMVPDTAMSDKTYYAKWTINIYTITAVVSPQDGGEITGLNETGEYEYNSLVTLTAVPAEGYDFTGWWINHENQASSTDPSYEITVTEDVYAEARFELHAYTITVTQPTAGGTVAAVLNDGTTEITITEIGTSVMGNWVQLTYEAAEDYSFDRFVVMDANNNEIETPNNGFIMPASDVTVTAVFTSMGQVATPSFSPAPGTYDSEHIPTVTISCSTPGATIHYTMDGTEPTVDSPVYTEPLTITGTTTIMAMAEADNMVNSGVATATYTIDQVYNINVNSDIANGTVVADPTTGTEGTVITLTPIPDEGYTFGGWNVTDGEGNEIPVGEDNTFELPAGDVNIGAFFVPMTYSLTLEAGQGTLINGFVRDTSYTYGVGFTLPTADDVEYTGHTFAGWYTNWAYTGEPITEISADAMGDTTVYAKWDIALYTITVSVNPEGAGTVTANPTSAEEGTVVTLTAIPATGYTFGGWNVTWAVDGSEEEIPVSDSNTFVMPAGNVIVGAVFVPMTYSLTLEIGQGTLLNGFVRDTSYTYGVGFTLPTANDVEYTGHTFAGWYTNAEFTGDPITKITAFAMGDTTVYAKWDISTYTLTIHYVYETGVEAAPTFTQTLNGGEQYNVLSPEIETYMPSQASVSGVMGEEDVEVTVVYTQIVMSDVADQRVCAGGFTDDIVFSSPLTIGTMSYAWTNDVTSIGLAGSGEGNIPSFDVVNTSSSPVTATITVTPTCTYNNMVVAGVPQTFTITVNPTSASEFSATAEDSYTWVEADTTITEEGTHDYVHVFTNQYGCDSVVTLHLTITVGIENYDLTNRVTLYPNPAHDIIHIDVEGDANVTGVEVFDVYGKVVSVVDGDNLPQAQQTSSIYISHLVEGVYVVRIRTDKGVAAKKFVKH